MTNHSTRMLHEDMMQEIEFDFKNLSHLPFIPPISEKVAHALATTPRHKFVPLNLQQYAYENKPLSIGSGQTISQPFIVALMTELAQIQSTDKILEIGTGSGYQAAILSQLASEVYSTEVHDELSKNAQKIFAELGYLNIHCTTEQGHGWPEHAPYDKIIVTAAAVEIPEFLLRQLKPGGIMVIPVGRQHQVLKVITKSTPLHIQDILNVAFVPFVTQIEDINQ
jgi:protein-L-isoaspartate(D-aspartate) O-methyltransferase